MGGEDAGPGGDGPGAAAARGHLAQPHPPAVDGGEPPPQPRERDEENIRLQGHLLRHQDSAHSQ